MSGRRGFLAAVAAGVATLPMAGKGITTTVMPLEGGSVLPSPDAELIALCAEFDAVEMRIRAIYDGPDAVSDDDAAREAVATAGERIPDILDRMDDLRASTPAGIQARAHTLALHNRDGGFSFDDPDTTCGRLVGCLMRDAAALGSSGVVVVIAERDANLLALCADLDEQTAELRAAEAVLDALPAGHTQAQCNAPWAAMEGVAVGWNDIHDEIAETPAVTMAGFRAKAAALRLSLLSHAGGGITSADLGECPEPHHRLAWSLVNDLLGDDG